MLDVCLLGTGGMMPLPYRWLTAFDGSLLGQQFADRLRGRHADCVERKGLESGSRWM